jgi:hypothetical protein
MVKVMPREYKRALAEQAKRARIMPASPAAEPVAVPVVAKSATH